MQAPDYRGLSYWHDTVAESLTAKLIRRHPHVFGEVKAETAEEAIEVWRRVKREEKRDASSD